jgi:hypothetical protein
VTLHRIIEPVKKYVQIQLFNSTHMASGRDQRAKLLLSSGVDKEAAWGLIKWEAPAEQAVLTVCSTLLCLKLHASYSAAIRPLEFLGVSQDYGHCESQHCNGCNGR